MEEIMETGPGKQPLRLFGKRGLLALLLVVSMLSGLFTATPQKLIAEEGEIIEEDGIEGEVIEEDGIITIYASDLIIYAEDYSDLESDAEDLKQKALMDGVYGTDSEGGDITDLIEIADDGGFTFEQIGEQTEAFFTVSYIVPDGDGGTLAEAVRTITVCQPEIQTALEFEQIKEDSAIYSSDMTIHAEDVTIYADDYLSLSYCADCGEAHYSSEELRMMAIMDDVYGWNSANGSISDLIEVADDGGFTLEPENGQFGASFNVRYIVPDENGAVLAEAVRTITVYRVKIQPLAATPIMGGDTSVPGSLLLVANTSGGMSTLQKYMGTGWSNNYCTATRIAWLVGTGYNGSSSPNQASSTAFGGTNWGAQLGTGIVVSEVHTGANQHVTIEWSKPWGGGYILFRHTVAYKAGEKYFTHKWEAENHTGATIDGIRLYYGGHHPLGGGSQNGWADYDSLTHEISSWKDTTQGIFILRSDGPEDPSHFHAAASGTPDTAVPNKTDLGDVTHPSGNEVHASFYLQWDTISLADGGTWTVNATEGIIDPGDLSVSSPVGQTVPKNITVTYEFTVKNLTNAASTVDLSLISSNGWNAYIDGAAQITLGVLGSVTDRQKVKVNLVVPADAVNGTTNVLTLTATNSGTFPFTATGTATTSVSENVPYISGVVVNSLSRNTLDVQVDYANLSASNNTKIEILNYSGASTSVTPVTQSIVSGGVVTGIDISSLALGTTYRIKATVDGITYPHNTTTFTLRNQLISGAVWQDSAGGNGVYDADEGILGINVYLDGSASEMRSSGSNGKLVFTGTEIVTDQNYLIWAEMPSGGLYTTGNFTAKVNGQSIGEIEASDNDPIFEYFTLTASTPGVQPALGFKLQSGISASDDVYIEFLFELKGEHNVSGKVTDARTGAVIVGATVTMDGQTATTDVNGQYAFATAVPNGGYTVSAAAAGYNSGSINVTVNSADVTNADIDLSAISTYSISGKVTDAGTGAAIAGATVTMGAQTTTTGANGEYTFTTAVPNGSYTISAVASRYTARNITVTVNGADITNANIGLSVRRNSSSSPRTPNTIIVIEPDKTPLGSFGGHTPYISGYPDGTFGAEESITREEAAVMLIRALNIETAQSVDSTSFSDVNPNHWSAVYIEQINEKDIMIGYADGTFGPEKYMSRAEFAVCLVMIMRNDGIDMPDADITFSDVDDEQWYAEYVKEAAAIGLMGGYDDGTFKPDKAITRVEAVIMLNNMLGRDPLSDLVLETDDCPYTDIDPSYWAYLHIMEASVQHEHVD